jgi:hypothetical protein
MSISGNADYHELEHQRIREIIDSGNPTVSSITTNVVGTPPITVTGTTTKTVSLNDGGVTDAKLGNRTVDQNIATASSNTGTLTQILSWVVKAIKNILGTGVTNWYDTPPTTLTTAASHITNTSNPHSTTALQVGALVSVDGVSNAGGNIDLIAGTNITIVPDDSANTITISSSAGGVSSVGATAPVTSTGGTNPVIGINVTATNDGGAVAKQATTPGTAQTGHSNITGKAKAGQIEVINTSSTAIYGEATTGKALVALTTTGTAGGFDNSSSTDPTVTINNATAGGVGLTVSADSHAISPVSVNGNGVNASSTFGYALYGYSNNNIPMYLERANNKPHMYLYPSTYTSLPSSPLPGWSVVDFNKVLWVHNGSGWQQSTIPRSTYSGAFFTGVQTNQLHYFTDRPGGLYQWDGTRWITPNYYVATFTHVGTSYDGTYAGYSFSVNSGAFRLASLGLSYGISIKFVTTYLVRPTHNIDNYWSFYIYRRTSTGTVLFLTEPTFDGGSGRTSADTYYTSETAEVILSTAADFAGGFQVDAIKALGSPGTVIVAGMLAKFRYIA